MKRLLKVTLAVLLLLVVALILMHRKKPKRPAAGDYSSLFGEVAALVKNDYVEPVDPLAKFPAACEALLGSLDGQSAYLDAGKTRVFLRLLRGDSCQAGIFGRMEGSGFCIVHVRNGSPAHKADLQRGDVITAVDQKTLLARQYWNAFLETMSERPISIGLAVKKRGAEEIAYLRLQLEPEPALAVVENLGKSTFLLRLRRLQPGTVQAVREGLKNCAMPRLIVDLTQYACGDLESFLELTRLFFPPDPGLTLKTKQGERPLAVGAPDHLNHRAVAIIDESTRAYGLLLAAIFQKHRFPLLGREASGAVTRTEHFPLADGSSVLLTTGFLLLDGANMAAAKVIPDHEIADERLDQMQASARRLLAIAK